MLSFDEYSAVRKRSLNQQNNNNNGNSKNNEKKGVEGNYNQKSGRSRNKDNKWTWDWNLGSTLQSSIEEEQQQESAEVAAVTDSSSTLKTMGVQDIKNNLYKEEADGRQKDAYSVSKEKEVEEESGNSNLSHFTPIGSISVLKQIGYLLETSECQSVLLVLVYLDMMVRFTMDYVGLDKRLMAALLANSGTDMAKNQSVLLSEAYDGLFFILNTFSAFCTAVLAIELIMLMMCFGRKFFFHIGYMFDTILLVLFVLNENTYSSYTEKSDGFSGSASVFTSSQFLQEQAKYASQESAKDATNWGWKLLSIVLNAAHSLCHLPKEIRLLAFF